MKNSEKEILNKFIQEFTDDFWKIDCLIRLTKEILNNDNLEVREDDVYYISKILTEISDNFTQKIKHFLIQNKIPEV